MFGKLKGSKYSCKGLNSLWISCRWKNSGFCHDCSVLWAVKPHQDPLGNLEVGWDYLCEEVILVWTQVWFGEKVPEDFLCLWMFSVRVYLSASVWFEWRWIEVIEAGHWAHCPALIPWHLQRINVRGGDTAGSYYCLKAFMRQHEWRPTAVDLQMAENATFFFFTTGHFFLVKEYANKYYTNLKSCPAELSSIAPWKYKSILQDPEPANKLHIASPDQSHDTYHQSESLIKDTVHKHTYTTFK